MDGPNRQPQNSSARDAAFEAFTKQIIADRLAAGDIDLRTMSFADMEGFAHELGQRLARAMSGELTCLQADLCSVDDNCPTCGLECEAIKHPREIQTVDGLTEVVELKSYCPKCRRSFFPCASPKRPR
jgi:hypothetical protein